MTRPFAALWTTLYAVVLALYCLLLLAVGAWLFPVQTHGGPAGLMFLMLGVILAPLTVLLWRGHLWPGVAAFVISLYPGVWPLLWSEVVACAAPLSRWLSEGVALLVVWGQLWACLKRPLAAMPWEGTAMLCAPAVFAVLTIVCIVSAASGRQSAED